jgi:hypothetical protein
MSFDEEKTAKLCEVAVLKQKEVLVKLIKQLLSEKVSSQEQS